MIDPIRTYMLHVDIQIEDIPLTDEIKAIISLLSHSAQQLANWMPSSANELSILLTNNEVISRLNHEWRSQNKPTDVLSFPSLFSEVEPDIFEDESDDIFGYGAYDLDDEETLEDEWDIENEEEEELEEPDIETHLELNKASMSTDESDLDDIIPVPLGDIVISVEFAREVVKRRDHIDRMQTIFHEISNRNDLPDGIIGKIAKQLQEWNLFDEVQFLLVHSYLHLLGWTHDTDSDDREMSEREFSLWCRLFTGVEIELSTRQQE